MLRRIALLLSAALAVFGIVATTTSPALLPVDAGPEGDLPPPRHETRDVRFRPMLIAGVLMLLGLLGILGLAAWIYPHSTDDQTINLPAEPFPAPQLQPNPPADMAAFRRRQLEELNGTYWIDQRAGRLHIPIEQAMRDVARHGIADWPTR